MDQAIRTAAARLRIGTFAFMALVLGLYLWARLGTPAGAGHLAIRTQAEPGTAAQLVADVTVLLLCIALVELSRMLALIQRGELFSVAVIRRFRAFALWLLVMAVLGFVAPLAIAWMSGVPVGRHRVAVLLDMRQLLTLGITLLLSLLARLLERAREIEAEMREIV
ncbi:MAG: DUF2975 domain-containing protein [Sphingomicrobium sp.]